MKVGIIVGSLRKESFARKIANNIAGLLPENVTTEFVNIDIPMYNQDLDNEGTRPQSWTTLREKIKECDAYLFVTPEYNRSIPPALKNALDIASCPYGQNVWSGKKGAIVSTSPSAVGGFGANHAIRQAVVFLNITMMQVPEMYIGGVDKLLDSNGKTIEKTTEFLKIFVENFIEFVG